MHSPDDVRRARETTPKVILDYIDSEELQKTVATIGKEMQFNLHEIARLTDAVTVTVLGLEPTASFPTTINEALPRVSVEQQAVVVQKINVQIFAELQSRQREPEAADTGNE